MLDSTPIVLYTGSNIGPPRVAVFRRGIYPTFRVVFPVGWSSIRSYDVSGSSGTFTQNPVVTVRRPGAPLLETYSTTGTVDVDCHSWLDQLSTNPPLFAQAARCITTYRHFENNQVPGYLVTVVDDDSINYARTFTPAYGTGLGGEVRVAMRDPDSALVVFETSNPVGVRALWLDVSSNTPERQYQLITASNPDVEPSVIARANDYLVVAQRWNTTAAGVFKVPEVGTPTEVTTVGVDGPKIVKTPTNGLGVIEHTDCPLSAYPWLTMPCVVEAQWNDTGGWHGYSTVFYGLNDPSDIAYASTPNGRMVFVTLAEQVGGHPGTF
jgi:hypothetical protein